MSIGTFIYGAGGRGFGVTGRGRTGSNLVIDKDRSQTEVVLSSTAGTECDMDWKTSLARHAWSILHAALYHVLGSVSAGHLYGIVVIWF